MSQILFPFLVSSLPRSKATPRYVPSPHYVLTESIISGPWRSNDSRPSPDFSPQLRDKICLQSGEIIHCVMNIVQNPQLFLTELRYKRQLCGESCGPGFISMSPVSKKIFGAHVLLSGGSSWVGIHIVNKGNRRKYYHTLTYTIVCESMGKPCSCMQFIINV